MTDGQPAGDTYSSERNKEICEFYKAGHTQTETCNEFGISASALYSILRREKVPTRTSPRRRRKLIDSAPISALHAQIGQDVAFRRHKMGMTPQEFAKAAGMTKERLRSIEMGVKEPTLTDLARLAKAAGIGLETLTTPRTIANTAGAA